MITFTQLGSLGRLGNQLFQYAALRSLSLRRDYEIRIPKPQDKQWHSQRCLLNNFNIEAQYLEDKDYTKINFQYTEPNPFALDRYFYYLGDGANLSGFFQSIFYFEECQEQIKKELTPKEHLMNVANDKVEGLKKQHQCEIVSIHIRRGDNTDNTDPRQVALNTFYGPIGSKSLGITSLYHQYITGAMNKFSNVKFLIFTGGNRQGNNNTTDMQWCKNSFCGEEFLFAENGSAIEDFCLISACDHNILSHVSSFGWWAAYLNKKENRVIAPRHYHPDIAGFTHREGFYPNEWELI